MVTWIDNKLMEPHRNINDSIPKLKSLLVLLAQVTVRFDLTKVRAPLLENTPPLMESCSGLCGSCIASTWASSNNSVLG